MIPIFERVEQYLSQRDQFGTGLSEKPTRELRKLAEFAASQGAEVLTVDLILRWKQQCGTASQVVWRNRLSHVRCFARWLRSLEPTTEVPPADLIPAPSVRPRPYIYTCDEIQALLAAAEKMPRRAAVVGPACAALFGLMAVTGIRSGEAVAVNDEDLHADDAVIHIRHAKNNRTRVLPVTQCTLENLLEYQALRERLVGTTDEPALFVGERGQRLSCDQVYCYFDRAAQMIGLREPQPNGRRGTGPRLHDLRHSFAVHTLIDWYRDGLDVDGEMYKLSTWLGHKSPRESYWYLESVPELLALAAERAEQALVPRRLS